MLACVGFPGAVLATDSDLLFADDSTLNVRVVAPFVQIMRDRPTDDGGTNSDDPRGTLSLIEDDGSVVNFPIRIVTRGNNRRNVCGFTPLRFDFRKDELVDTVFEGQNKIKVVTHCRNRSKEYRQTVIREYLAYRILNILTDTSFRVRLMHITYDFSDQKNKEEETFAFFIENKNRFGERMNLDEQFIERITVDSIDRAYLNLTSVFTYLIGNVDYSPVQGRKGERCCHNHTLFSADGDTFWSVPYDFDSTGFVDAPHVELSPNFKQSTIRQRIYRGRCHNQDLLPATLQIYKDKRADIEALLEEQPELTNKVRKQLLRYVGRFFKLLEDEDQLIEDFAEACI
ncbi:MAG: hypothetical protein ACR2QS_03220 [Woeseiaceae bacterium]